MDYSYLDEVGVIQVGTTPSGKKPVMMGPQRAALEHRQPSQLVLSQKVKSYTWGCEN